MKNDIQEIMKLVHAFAGLKFKQAMSKSVKEDLINILQAKNIEKEIEHKLRLFGRKNDKLF